MYRPPFNFSPMTQDEARAIALAAAERVRLKRLIRQMAGSDLDGKIGTMDVDQLRTVVEGLGGECE
jgi:hypothetical protein